MLTDVVAVYSIDSIPSQADGMPVCAIYAIKNLVTGNVYIGSSDHVIRRFRHHISRLRRGVHHSLRLQFAWKNRGEKVFEFIVLEIVSPEDDLIRRENEVIESVRPAYNFNLLAANNPMKGRRHSLQSIERMSANRCGKGLGPRVFTKAHCAALSAAALGKPRPSRRGKRLSDAARQNMSEAARAAYANGRINARTRAVETNGRIFASGKEAAAFLGISHSALCNRIKKGFGRYRDDAKA